MLSVLGPLPVVDHIALLRGDGRRGVSAAKRTIAHCTQRLAKKYLLLWGYFKRLC